MSNKKLRNKNSNTGSENPRVQAARDNPGKVGGAIAYLKSHLLLVVIVSFLALGALGAGLKYLDENAQRELAKRANQKGYLNSPKDEPVLNKINPFLPDPTPSPTPQLSKEYIYAGSRLLAVADANASAAPPVDLAIWRRSSGEWWVMGSQGGSQQVTVQWGISTDKALPGDYDGDGKTDFAVYRPADQSNSGVWWIIRSSDNTYYTNQLGGVGDKPAPADYDGDGKTDPALFRPSTGTWYILQSSNLTVAQGVFGSSVDEPAPADYDGDGRADLAFFKSSQNAFYSLNSSDNQMQIPTFDSSQTGDKIVSADYDGDGKADFALYNSTTAYWYIFQSSNWQILAQQFGNPNDEPVHNDYDGDGKVDIAVWRGVPSTSPGSQSGNWHIRTSSNPNSVRVETWGMTGDVPVPAFYHR